MANLHLYWTARGAIVFAARRGGDPGRGPPLEVDIQHIEGRSRCRALLHGRIRRLHCSQIRPACPLTHTNQEALTMSGDNQDMTPGTALPPTQETTDWRDRRQADRAARREGRLERRGRHNYRWLWGGVLIVLGVELLLENMGFTFPDNWWALFILIPAFGAFARAWEGFRL